MNANTQHLTGTLYFGLSVEVVHKMENYSWVRFSGHDAIVDTDDLALFKESGQDSQELVHRRDLVRSV